MTRYLFNRSRARARIAGLCGQPEEVSLPLEQEQFYERLGEDADVRLEPGYNQDEFFDDQFERRAHEIQRTPNAVGAVSVIPAKRGPWSGNNNLGIERPFAPDENNRQTILRLDEWGFPELWTLCLGLTYNAELYGSGGLTGTFRVLAEVEFGTGGVVQYLEMDWVQGATIVLPMNALNVVASFTGPAPTEAGQPTFPEDLRLRANIVHGNLTAARPSRTYLLDGFDTVAIPPFATSVSIVGSPAFAFYESTDAVRFTNTNGGSNVMGHQRSQFVQYLDIINQVVGAPVYVDVPEGARFLTVVNGEGALVRFRLGV